jgi:fructosamine-3-kinase
MQIIDETIKNLAVGLVEQNQLGSFNGIEVLVGSGEVNQVFLVSANDSKFVLRLNDLSELDRFKKEQWCIDATLANGIPGSRVIDIGEYNEYAYMFLEFIKGRNDRDILESNDFWYLLGKYLLKIHSINVKGFGENLDDILNGSRNQWTQYLNYNISSLNSSDVLIKMGVLNKNSSRSFKDLLESLSKKDFKFGLNHGDYSLSNIIVDDNSVPHVMKKRARNTIRY